MKREKEVPADLLVYLESLKNKTKQGLEGLNKICTMPVRAVKMKCLVSVSENKEEFRTVIIPSIDIWAQKKPVLRRLFLRCDFLMYFIAQTDLAFPFGHVYKSSGTICLGNIFVPSAVPECSPAMPLETLFLHNDQNLNHGGASLRISKYQVDEIEKILEKQKLPGIAKKWLAHGEELLRNDQIWNLSADVLEKRPLPEACQIMGQVYDVIFEPARAAKRRAEEERKREEMESDG